jgi:ribosome assembly protein RRB1
VISWFRSLLFKFNLYRYTEEGGKWAVDKNAPFKGHTSSVEDCQWSPAEKDVFASCSADQTVCIWDCRTKNKPALRAKVHDSDVNVMSWNRLANCMLATVGRCTSILNPVVTHRLKSPAAEDCKLY